MIFLAVTSGLLVDYCCNYCDENDDIVHFFIKCENTSKFWQTFTNWLGNTLEEDFKIMHHDIIFGHFSDAPRKDVINYCLIIAKYYIYLEKLKGNNDINLLTYLSILKKELLTKYEYACITNQVEEFDNKWNCIYREI